MLPRSSRISKKALAAGTMPFRFIGNTAFSVRIRSNMTPVSRFSVIVSKKIDTRAVVRNRVKRRITEAIRGVEQPKTGWDMLVYAKKNAQELSLNQMQQSLQTLFQTNHIS